MRTREKARAVRKTSLLNLIWSVTDHTNSENNVSFMRFFFLSHFE